MAISRTDTLTEKSLPGQQTNRFVQWAFGLDSKKGKGTESVRACLRVCIIMYREYFATNISLRASALTYSIILSMVPLLAMSTAILKGLGSDNQLKIAAYHFIDQLEPTVEQPAVTLSEPSMTVETEDQPIASTSLTDHLRNAVDTIFAYVEQTNFAALGAFGIAGLLVVVVLVLSTVEEAMNAIWHTSRGRPLLRKVLDYLALLVLLPISVNVALAGGAILASPKMMAVINTIIPSPWAVNMLLQLIPFLFVVLTLMIVYLFFPHVKVKTHAAFIGALFASFFWFLTQKIYIILQVGVAKYNAIYGSFATVPLFLVWLHIGWTFILLGAILAYSVQHHNQYYRTGNALSPQRRVQVALDIMQIVYEQFFSRKETTLAQLNESLPHEQPSDIRALVELLEQGRLLNRVEKDATDAFVPVAPAEDIAAGEIVRLIFGHDSLHSDGGLMSEQIVEAAESAIERDKFPTLPVPTAGNKT